MRWNFGSEHTGQWPATVVQSSQYLHDGTFVLKWQLHWVSGWDPEHGEYRASMVDNYGHAMVYRGWIDDDHRDNDLERDLSCLAAGIRRPCLPARHPTMMRPVTDTAYVAAAFCAPGPSTG